MSNEFKKMESALTLRNKASFGLVDEPQSETLYSVLAKAQADEREESPLVKALKAASGVSAKGAPQLAFTENPAPSDNYLGLYKSKRRLLPDEVIKQIRVTDHLIASILRIRSGMLSLFGNLRQDRFSAGIEIEILPEIYEILSSEQHVKVLERIKRAEKLLMNCGHTEGLENQDKLTLASFLSTSTMNGISFGRFGVEMIYDLSADPDEDGNYPFHRFRPVDVATIYKAVRKGEQIGNNLRQLALNALQSLKGEKINIDVEKLKEDKYAWLQIIDGTPRQAFTHDEMIVYNLFESTDIEHNGYPVSPLDTIVSSVTTHISIDAYKKLYFQNGRATKGMLVIQSDEVDEPTLNSIKTQFNASINSVSNSFRTPIFGVGADDEVKWVSMVGEGLTDEFEYMYDQIARVIMSAFSISPDELPGYGHLSRGTNSQTMSESSNEYKLSAARDAGLRPLILQFQTFFNQRLFPLIDPFLAKICTIKFAGLDAQSKEQESARLQQDSALHMNYDDILNEVDKKPIGAHIGGKMPMNERLQIVLDKYSNVGDVRTEFFKDPSSALDPMQRYKRDPFALQQLQLMAEISPLTVKAFYAPKPYAIDFLKMNIEDYLEDLDDAK